MPLPHLPLALALVALVGSAGFGVAQSNGNPATIDQLSIPPIPFVTPTPASPRLDPATIAAQNLELQIAEAQDAAFAAALLDALLKNRLESSPNPPIFIPHPPAVLTSYLGEAPPRPEAAVFPQLSALRPAPRPPAVARGERAVQTARNAPSRAVVATLVNCAKERDLWNPGCATRLGAASAPADTNIKTLDDGVYVKD